MRIKKSLRMVKIWKDVRGIIMQWQLKDRRFKFENMTDCRMRWEWIWPLVIKNNNNLFSCHLYLTVKYCWFMSSVQKVLQLHAKVVSYFNHGNYFSAILILWHLQVHTWADSYARFAALCSIWIIWRSTSGSGFVRR